MSRLNELADVIGDLRSKIKILQSELAEAENHLKAEGCTVVEGKLFRVAISYNVERATTNWKKIALRFEPSHQLLAANTKTSVHDRVSVTAVLTH